jgi:hypothetical protein
MTRRGLLAAIPVLRVFSAFDLVRVITRVNGGAALVWWEPRAVAEERFRPVFAFIAEMRRNRH